MNIKFLGTGGAFDFAKGTAAAVVEVGEKKILIDCGFSTLPTLAKSGLAKEIDYILVTHLHGDHVGGLPTLIAYLPIKLQREIPIIVPTDAFQQELHTFMTCTYEDKRANYVPISDFPEIGFVETTNQHMEGMQSFAYYFSDGEHLIYYSGDIGNADVAKQFLETRTETKIEVFHETTFIDGVAGHTYYKELPEKLGEYDMYAYHIDKANKPDDCVVKLVEEYPEFLV